MSNPVQVQKTRDNLNACRARATKAERDHYAGKCSSKVLLRRRQELQAAVNSYTMALSGVQLPHAVE
jgi:hypothetical protein